MPTKENSSLPLLISPRLEGENNREYAYRVLRQNIITLQFAPGQTLSEAELSEKLEMSRTPVHEAVMMLKNEWLVDVQAQRGSSVSMIRVDYLQQNAFLENQQYSSFDRQARLLDLILRYKDLCDAAIERGADIWKLYAIAARAAIGRAKTVPADTYQDVYAKIVSDMEQQIEEVAKEAEAE